MPDRTFTIQLGEDERLMHLAALGFAARASAATGNRPSIINALIAEIVRQSARSRLIAPISANRCSSAQQHGTAGLLPTRSQRQRTIRTTRRRGTENREDRWRARDGQQDAG